jgi:hypothetical protein
LLLEACIAGLVLAAFRCCVCIEVIGVWRSLAAASSPGVALAAVPLAPPLKLTLVTLVLLITVLL